MKNIKKPELLSPIQDFTSLKAAIDNGADAVFFGIKGYNMRAGAKNFTVRDLKKISSVAKDAGIKTYLAINTIFFEKDLPKIEALLKKVKESGINAIICWDLSVIQIAKKIGLEFHISTQASIANSSAAAFYKKLGAKRVVLARECSLKEIKKIKENIDVEVEVFIHGAMCVSVSGRCFLSQFMYGKSANCGECRQPCRRKYIIKQIDDGKELEIGQNYVLSPKDLCTIDFIEEILKADVDCLKIEGRNRSPEYVALVTRSYREVIDFYFDNKDKKNFKTEFDNLKMKLKKGLEDVFNRGQSSGFYLGKPLNEWSREEGNHSKVKKIQVGVVTHYYKKIQVAEILIQNRITVKKEDEILIQGPNTGVHQQKINSLEKDNKEIKKASQGEKVAIKVTKDVKKNDEVFILRKEK